MVTTYFEVKNNTRQGANMDGYLGVTEVARRLGVTNRTVLRLAHNGNLPGAVKKNPYAQTSPVMIPEKSVLAFLDKRDQGIVAEQKPVEGNAEKNT